MVGPLFTSSNDSRRLSKPRTNTSSVTLISSDHETDTKSPLGSSDQQDYFGDYAAVVSSQGENRSRRKSRSRIRAYLYGSNAGTMQTPSDDDDGHSALAGAARDVRKRLSRTGSSVMQLQSAKPSTARLSDSSSSRLPLSGSLSSETEDSALVADQIKEKAHQDRIAAQNHVTSPLDNDKHVDSVKAPVRRKSLYTPGLATRSPSDILKKPPQTVADDPQIDRDYYYDPSKPKESPLSQLAALHLVEDGRTTPSNMNYPQLGGLQLGTLRVTNGVASPIPRNRTPDIACRSPPLEVKAHDEGYMVSEGRMLGEQILVDPPSEPGLLFSGNRAGSSDTSDHGIIVGPYRSIQSQYSDSALSIAHEYISEFEGAPFVQCDGPDLDLEHTSLDDEAKSMSEAENHVVDNRRNFIIDEEVRYGHNETQEDALRKLNGSIPPLIPSNDLRRPLNAYSIGSRHSEYAEVPYLDSGYVSNTSLGISQIKTQSDVPDPKSSMPSQQPGQITAQCGPAELEIHADAREPADGRLSGPRDVPQSVLEQGRYSLQEAGPPPLPYTFSVTPRTTLQVPALFSTDSHPRSLARKLQKRRPKSQPPLPIVPGQDCRELAETHIPRVPSVVAVRHAERLRKFPVLDHTFPSSQHTNVTKYDSVSRPDTSIYPLPIRFPSPENALEAAVSGSFSEPSRTGTGYRSRSKSFWKPRDNAIGSEEKSESRSRASSKHRISITAEEQDEEWPNSGIVRSPSWSDFGRGRKLKEQKKLMKKEKENEKRLVTEERILEKRLRKDRKDFEKQNKKGGQRQSTRSRSASRTRARSSNRSNQGEVLAISDFGTVSESLGGSPYDIARSMFPPVSCDTSNSYPHPRQITTAATRPKSIIGSSEVTHAAAVPAQYRAKSQSFSRSKAPDSDFLGKLYDDEPNAQRHTTFTNLPPTPAVAAIDLRARGIVPASGKRGYRNSISTGIDATESSDNRGVPDRCQSPYGGYTDVPPMPTLPLAQQVTKQEAQIGGARPQSMTMNESPVSSAPILRNNNATEGFHNENRASVSEIPARLRKGRTGTAVPDLWSNGSIERKIPRGEEATTAETQDDQAGSNDNPANGDNMWEAQRQAWRQRRQSAGEALLKDRMVHTNERPSLSNSLPQQEPRDGSQVRTRSSTARSPDGGEAAQMSELRPSLSGSIPDPLTSHLHLPSQAPSTLIPNTSILLSTPHHPPTTDQTQPQPPLRPGPSPLTSRPPAPAQSSPADSRSTLYRTPTQAMPRKSIDSGSTTPTRKSIERLSDRYDGGLLYGYEPGCGLGGSAGTRGRKTGASRKSVEVSRGFGLDLSDVPIFVAPTAGGR